MRECAWTEQQIERALCVNYNGPLMRIDVQAYRDRRDIPKYRVNEVALYLGVRESTLRTWFFGHQRKIKGVVHSYDPLIKPALHNPYGPSLSFFNLAEAHVLSAIRQKWQLEEPEVSAPQAVRPTFGQKLKRSLYVQVSMQAARAAIAYIEKESPIHPLISQYFYTNGKELFVQVLEGELGHHLTVNVSRQGQISFSSILDMYLSRVERDASGAIRVYPMRQLDDPDKSIVILPNVASGRPVIAGTGVRVEVIWKRSQAGEAVEDLAEDYGIEPRAIKKAISYFTNVKAA